MKLTIENISKSFGKQLVFDGLSAEIPAGSIVALVGANGAGKTTLLRCLSTLSSPAEGSIRFDGEELKRGRLDLRKKLMFLSDFPEMFGDTPAQAAAVALRLWEAEKPDIENRVVEWFERLGILSKADSHSASFSRGEKYKAALTMLLAVDPELWLLDEPFASGMDPQGINVFRDEANQAKRRGRIIVYSTQLVELACGFSDIVGVLDSGKLTLYSTVAELNRDPAILAALVGEGNGLNPGVS